MGCYRRILVAVDGSPDAEIALRHAATLARDQHARLILLTVVPPAPPHMAAAAGAAVPAGEVERAYVTALRRAAEALPPDLSVETRVCQGPPARRILDVAERAGCDLIVMGYHGHGRLHAALMGSVSRSVMHDTALPVLLMRADAHAPAAPLR
jgi:nucleotide-binding universal stress UspA family protein